MSQDPNCAVCNAERPNLVGICVECGGCFSVHCQCDACQHGKARLEECVFCQRGTMVLLDAIVIEDDIAADLRWLMGPSEEMS